MNEIIFSLLIGGWISFLGIFLYWYLTKEEKENMNENDGRNKV